ncbi:hypothetical protein VNO78_34930 [Psophocarpus tetragonolobus]|uniref:Uncharacterized protein n=1 Tax=Psophocarpus tetragonolobus TaxID=3891 RepID=A0AAN9NSE7_PSOTE
MKHLGTCADNNFTKFGRDVHVLKEECQGVTRGRVLKGLPNAKMLLKGRIHDTVPKSLLWFSNNLTFPNIICDRIVHDVVPKTLLQISLIGRTEDLTYWGLEYHDAAIRY